MNIFDIAVYFLPLGLARDLHPSDNTHAEQNKKSPAAPAAGLDIGVCGMAALCLSVIMSCQFNVMALCGAAPPQSKKFNLAYIIHASSHYGT